MIIITVATPVYIKGSNYKIHQIFTKLLSLFDVMSLYLHGLGAFLDSQVWLLSVIPIVLIPVNFILHKHLYNICTACISSLNPF